MPELNTGVLPARKFSLHNALQGRLSLVCVAYTSHAEPYAEQYRAAFRNAVGLHYTNTTQIINVAPVMSTLKWLLLRLARPGFVVSGNEISVMPLRPRWFAFHLRIPNDLSVYAYIVDVNGRIRWRASGKPTDADLASMAHLLTNIPAPAVSSA